jgi:hypothetical protein
MRILKDLAKDMIKLNQRQTGYAGMWLRPIEGSVAHELELADPFFTHQYLI